MRLTVTEREVVFVQRERGWYVHWLNCKWGAFRDLAHAQQFVEMYQAQPWRAPEMTSSATVEVA